MRNKFITPTQNTAKQAWTSCAKPWANFFRCKQNIDICIYIYISINPKHKLPPNTIPLPRKPRQTILNSLTQKIAPKHNIPCYGSLGNIRNNPSKKQQKANSPTTEAQGNYSKDP